jgi:hypothetical protein
VVRNRQSGVALLWALLALTAVAAAVLLLASLLVSRQVASRYEYRSVVLNSLSDAAMAETLAELARDPAFQGVAQRRFGMGTISSSMGSTPYGVLVVTAVGEYDDWVSVVRAEVSIQGGPRVVNVERRQVANR